MQKRSITGNSQFSQLKQMFALYPRQHLQNTSHYATGNILVGLSKGVGQGPYLHPEPIQHVTKSSACIGKFKALPTELANGFLQIAAETVQLCAKQLTKSLSFFMLRLLQIFLFSSKVLRTQTPNPQNCCKGCCSQRSKPSHGSRPCNFGIGRSKLQLRICLFQLSDAWVHRSLCSFICYMSPR
jgi:hypothetical protein